MCGLTLLVDFWISPLGLSPEWFGLQASAQIYQLGFRLCRYPSGMEVSSPKPRRVAQLRRSPKLSAFVALSAVLGFFVTLILTGLYPADPTLGFATLFAYFALYGVTGTVALGIVLWLVLDLRSRKKATEVTVERDDS